MNLKTYGAHYRAPGMPPRNLGRFTAETDTAAMQIARDAAKAIDPEAAVTVWESRDGLMARTLGARAQ